MQFDIPVVLGPAGTALAAVVILAQTAMAFYSWRRSNAVKILKDELDIYKGKVNRLESEDAKKEKRIAQLEEEEAECRGKLDKLTALYLESKGQEEDEHRPRRRQ